MGLTTGSPSFQMSSWRHREGRQLLQVVWLIRAADPGHVLNPVCGALRLVLSVFGSIQSLTALSGSLIIPLRDDRRTAHVSQSVSGRSKASSRHKCFLK